MHIGTSALVLALAGLAMACDSSVEGGGDGSGTGGGGGGGGDATTGSSTTGDSTASTGSGDPYPLDCATRPRCAEGQLNELRTECPDETWCIYYPGCLTPVCVAPDEACAAHCGTGFCDVLTSVPAELECRAPSVYGVDELTCEDLQSELDVIQACTSDDQCGRVLPGTSCGCTRDLVARTDVPVDVFEAMLAAAGDLSCFGSDCDCPETDGFACVDGRCTWNYLE